MGKLKTAVALGGRGIDLLVGNVSPLYWESFMPYEILNEVKTYVGELPLFERSLERIRGPEKFLRSYAL